MGLNTILAYITNRPRRLPMPAAVLKGTSCFDPPVRASWDATRPLQIERLPFVLAANSQDTVSTTRWQERLPRLDSRMCILR